MNYDFVQIIKMFLHVCNSNYSLLFYRRFPEFDRTYFF